MLDALEKELAENILKQITVQCHAAITEWGSTAISNVTSWLAGLVANKFTLPLNQTGPAL